MRPIDRLLQRWRLRMGMQWLGNDVRVIDVGAHRGELFEALGPRLREGFGIESLADCERQAAKFVIHRGLFPVVKPAGTEWDAITLFAVLEHIPRAEHAILARACFDLLRVGGRVVITVPAKAADHLLFGLRLFRLIDGMSLEEHFGFEAAETDQVFSAPLFKLVQHRRFQLGFNNLFVFEKQPEPSPGPVPANRDGSA
jgi:hypothetical protein